jgi:hypothetical protein
MDQHLSAANALVQALKHARLSPRRRMFANQAVWKLMKAARWREEGQLEFARSSLSDARAYLAEATEGL